MNYYEVLIWDGEEEADNGVFNKFICLIDSKTVDKILGNDCPKFIKTIIDDGQEMIVQTENIYSLLNLRNL